MNNWNFVQRQRLGHSSGILIRLRWPPQLFIKNEFFDKKSLYANFYFYFIRHHFSCNQDLEWVSGWAHASLSRSHGLESCQSLGFFTISFFLSFWSLEEVQTYEKDTVQLWVNLASCGKQIWWTGGIRTWPPPRCPRGRGWPGSRTRRLRCRTWGTKNRMFCR